MKTPMGYEFTTTLVTDFQIASRFGSNAVREIYERVFKLHKHDIVWMTELYVALNWEIWRLFEVNPKLARAYQDLWDKLGEYIYDNFTGDDIQFFFKVTD